jgi:putative sigma-54 modulation protein
MNLTISGHHVEVSPALRVYALAKLDRVTRHFSQVVDVSVLLSVEKLKEKERRQKVEVNLHVKGRDIFMQQTHEDMYAAIDKLMAMVDDITNYQAPEMLENGDIIIRRKPDAPPVQPPEAPGIDL